MEMKVDFRGKKLSLLEAKLLVIGLRTGITKPNLTQEEKEDYVKNEEGKKRDNELTKKRGHDSGIWREDFSEKDYILQKLKMQIGLIEMNKKFEYCNEHGHKEKVNSYGNSGAYCICERCGIPYTRNMTSDEWENFDKIMKTPFTI